MRISDWSSDVCSSDLKRQAHEPTVKIGVGAQLASQIARARGFDLDDIGPHQSQLMATKGARQHIGQVEYANKIGSASCRERVLSVRVDLGGRRIIKKKNRKT